MLQEILIIDIYPHKMYYVPNKSREDYSCQKFWIIIIMT